MDFSELIGYGVALYIGFWIGSRLTQEHERIRTFGVSLGIVVGVIVGLLLLARSTMQEAMDWIGLLVQSVFTGASVTAATWILLPALDLFSRPFRWTGARAQSFRAARVWDKEQKQQLEDARVRREAKEEAERQRIASLPKPPPPKTREELLTDARLRHQKTIRELEECLTGYELEAAKLKAKQTYLNDLDGLL